MRTVTRAEAKARGLKRYFTGKLCKNGHIGERYTSNINCVDCNIHQVKTWRAENVEFARLLRRQWTANNREKQKAQRKRLYERNRDRNRALKKARYDRDPEIHRARTRKWRKKNIDLAIKRAREWRANNPEKVRVIKLNRECSVRGAPGHFTEGDILGLFRRQKGVCVYCPKKLRAYHIDHIRPISRGGSNWPRNLQLLCPRCNCSKGAKTHVEYIKFLQKAA